MTRLNKVQTRVLGFKSPQSAGHSKARRTTTVRKHCYKRPVGDPARGSPRLHAEETEVSNKEEPFSASCSVIFSCGKFGVVAPPTSHYSYQNVMKCDATLLRALSACSTTATVPAPHRADCFLAAPPCRAAVRAATPSPPRLKVPRIQRTLNPGHACSPSQNGLGSCFDSSSLSHLLSIALKTQYYLYR